jgi:hypothetical protein
LFTFGEVVSIWSMRRTTIRWAGAHQIRRIACPAQAGSERRSLARAQHPLNKIIGIVFIIFLPAMVYGQRKDCNVIYMSAPAINCCLIPIKIVNDTILTFLPADCNVIKFDSTANGQWNIYSADSIKLETVGIKNGKRNGVGITFYKNGQVETKANYKKGELNGNYISFYEDGKILREGYYKKNAVNGNAFNGIEYEYWDNGITAHEMRYKKGGYFLWRDQTFWDKNGNVTDYDYYSKHWYDCK